MSLAEKGKVCRESSASSTSSNVSADDDLLRNHAAAAAMRNHQPHSSTHHPFHTELPTHNPRTLITGNLSSTGTNNINTGNQPPSASGQVIPSTSNRQPLSRSSSTSTSRCGDSLRESIIRPTYAHSHRHQHHPSISSSSSAPATTNSGGGILTMVNSNPNFRRMMLPPRTKSVDSESPPPSEPGLSTYGDSYVDQDVSSCSIIDFCLQNLS